jgi:hypothetical protein
MAREFTPSESARIAEIQEQMRRLEALANKHHLLVVGVSPRRTIVVERGSAHPLAKSDQQAAAWFGKSIFGPATREDCEAFIVERLKTKGLL